MKKSLDNSYYMESINKIKQELIKLTGIDFKYISHEIKTTMMEAYLGFDRRN